MMRTLLLVLLFISQGVFAQAPLRTKVFPGAQALPLMAGVQEKIFEPTFTTKPTGHGFGLATCYRIAAAHRGRISVESEAGRGATFLLVLPVGVQAGW